MPNISEIVRREEELIDAVGRVNNLKLSKSDREAALREVRQLETELGIEVLGNYNRPSAQEQQDETLLASWSSRLISVELTGRQVAVILGALEEANRRGQPNSSFVTERDEIIGLLNNS